jgi:hypothetical protein
MGGSCQYGAEISWEQEAGRGHFLCVPERELTFSFIGASGLLVQKVKDLPCRKRGIF